MTRRPAGHPAGAPWLPSVAGRTAFVQSFPATGADAHGRVYVTWSDGQRVYLAVSTNRGETFTVREDVLDDGHSGTFSTLAVTPSGGVAVAYYDTPGEVNSAFTEPGTPWTVRVATNQQPWVEGSAWTRAQVSAGVVHQGSITSKGTADICGFRADPGTLNRRLADDFEIALTAGRRRVPEGRRPGGVQGRRGRVVPDGRAPAELTHRGHTVAWTSWTDQPEPSSDGPAVTQSTIGVVANDAVAAS